jgi:UPF0755 protein
VRFIFTFVLAITLAIGACGYWWLHQPFDLPAATVVEVSIEPGSPARDVANAVAQAGVAVNPTLLYGWFRVSGQSRLIKAGNYEIGTGTTPISLLQKLVRGEEALRSVTLVEGWTFAQVQAALQRAEQLKPDSLQFSGAALMDRLGKPGTVPEGRFFPDTYTYAKGSSDLKVLLQAMRAMDQQLSLAWALRTPSSPLQTPEQALILASIIEKETGSTADRALIGAVFNNRLRIGMRLQTDPTVIYGLGTTFDGNLRKRDLIRDTPWNTYVRAGLPPTPISMPGKASLLSAVQPADSAALYFVARGDGSSAFSATLDEHNRAVNKYQRGQ